MSYLVTLVKVGLDRSTAEACGSPSSSAWAQKVARGRIALVWQRFRGLSDGTSPLVLATILLLAFAVYAPTLNDWFSGDDFWFLRSAQKYSFWEYARKAFDIRETGALSEFDRYRPVYPIVWWLQYAVFGLNAGWYHLVVVLLHVANTALVWLIARRLLGNGWAPAAAALIFALHPAYADAVAWLSGANRVFAMFPYLLSLFLFMQFVDGTGARKVICYCGALAGFLVAILMHSAGLTLVVILPGYYFLIARPSSPVFRVGTWLPFVPFLSIAMALVIAQIWVRDHLGAQDQFSIGWHQYSIYGDLLGRALFPVLPLGSGGVSKSLIDALEAAQGIASVVVLILAMFLMTRTRTLGLSIFVVGWLFLALFPDSTLRVFSLTSGRMMYLASAALAIFFALSAMHLYRILPERAQRPAPRIVAAAAALLVVCAFALTMHHSDKYSESGERNEAFAKTLQRDVPDVPRGGVFYVVNAPPSITVFDDSRLDSLIELYFGDLEVRAVKPDDVDELEGSLQPLDRIYRYRP